MRQKRPKYKIVTKGKCYPLHDSIFYKLSNKQRLAKLLYSTLPELKALCSDSNYHCFIDRNGKKPRPIQAPLFKLDRIHSRIASLLSRLEVFDGLHSGKKGRSNISNAKAHIGPNRRVVTVDIKNFYPNTSRSNVFKFFNEQMKCASDVADLLSRLLTYEGHIPTGSRVSMPLAYFANKKMFDEMAASAANHCVTMTIYVDDLTFSGATLRRSFIPIIAAIAKKHNHELHPEKTRFFAASEVKLITGGAVSGDKVLPRNKHLLTLHNRFEEWKMQTDFKKSRKIANRVLGHLNFFGSIDTRYKSRALTFRKIINK